MPIIRPPAPKISVIIACYRDELAIPVMYRRLKKIFALIKIRHEIIFVNDNSPDNSALVLKQLAAADPSVIAIHHSRNFGSQQAFTSGLAIASGNMAVLMD